MLKLKKAWSTYIVGKYNNLLQVFQEISRTPDFEQKFWAKKCGSFASFYSIPLY